MQISDDQISRVMRYLGAGDDAAPSSCVGNITADPRLVEEIKQHLRGMPDVRKERVRHLRRNIDTYTVGSERIAAKMIGRALGDQLR